MAKKRPVAAIAALSLSLAVLIDAMATAWRLGLAANEVDHRLYHMNETLEQMRAAVAALEDQRRAERRTETRAAR